jgi:hypothetical protein
MPGRRFSTLAPFQGRSVLELHPRLPLPTFVRGEPPLDEAPPAASIRRRERVLITRWADLGRGPCERNFWGSSLILPSVGGPCPQCLAVGPSGLHHEQNPAARRPGSSGCQPILGGQAFLPAGRRRRPLGAMRVSRRHGTPWLRARDRAHESPCAGRIEISSTATPW